MEKNYALILALILINNKEKKGAIYLFKLHSKNDLYVNKYEKVMNF